MLRNKSKKKVLSGQVKLCTSFLLKFKGLMFSSRKEVVDKSYVFVFDREQSAGLHMWFVFYPIDVLFLDSKKRVVEIKERFLPFTFYFPTRKAKYVVELGAGKIRKTSTQVGDLIEFCEEV